MSKYSDLAPDRTPRDEKKSSRRETAQWQIDRTPAPYTALRRAREAAADKRFAWTRENIQRERKRLNQQDHRARLRGGDPPKRPDCITTVRKISRYVIMVRLRELTAWLATPGKRQAKLLAGGKSAMQAVKPIMRLWVTYQRLVAKVGHAPGQTEFGRRLGITPSKAQHRLRFLASLEAEGGPWHDPPVPVKDIEIAAITLDDLDLSAGIGI